MSIHFIGDVHGRISELENIIKQIPAKDDIFQVGDLGLGFVPVPQFEKNFKFIRGNHDSPIEAKNHPNYLGDYGYNLKNKMYYISGAFSIDYKIRKEGHNWWSEEELSYPVLLNVIEDCINKKPEIILSHDCPYEITKYMKSHHIEKTRTNMALNEIFSAWQPSYWICGHHHTSFNKFINKTKFVVLNELELFKLNK